jgi:D-methionine transport system substrate-binding protein
MKKALFALAAIATVSLNSSWAHAKDLIGGVSAGPYGDILSYAAELAKKDGINVKIVEFSDWTLPNIALAEGDLDFNHFQHKPYLDNQIDRNGWELVAVEPTVIVPFGIYSHTLKNLNNVTEGATVTIPNDPTNGARALQLLESTGLIRLDAKAGVKATTLDVVDNPKHLKFREIDAAQLPRALDDVEVGTVSLNYALAYGLDPKSALVTEDKASQWGLWLVTRQDNQNDPDLRKFFDIVRSDKVKAFIKDHYNDTIIPVW